MFIKSFICTLFLFVGSFSAQADGVVNPLTDSELTELIVTPTINAVDTRKESCTVNATFTSGSTKIKVEVTAETCEAAYKTLGSIATAIDAEK